MPKTKTSPCRVCKSPYRKEMEFLVSQGIAKYAIAEKYCPKFNCKMENLYNILKRHTDNKHPPLLADMEIGEPTTGNSFEDYASKLLKVGYNPEMMSPKRVTHNNIISAQRTLIEEKKVNGALDAQKLAFLKFFRGTPQPIEGETVDGENDTRGTESLPTNTE